MIVMIVDTIMIIHIVINITILYYSYINDNMSILYCMLYLILYIILYYTILL